MSGQKNCIVNGSGRDSMYESAGDEIQMVGITLFWHAVEHASVTHKKTFVLELCNYVTSEKVGWLVLEYKRQDLLFTGFYFRPYK